MISKFVDNLWRPRRSKHHRRSKRATAPMIATEKLEDRTLLSGQDLVAFAQALTAANVTLYGAAWDADTTQQKALLEDGAQFLNFVDVTNADRTLNSNATIAGITEGMVRPIWRLNDGTLIEGSTINTLQDLSTATGVAILNSDGPFLKEIADQNLLSGTGLHVALDGYDPDNGGLIFHDAVSSNPDIEARILRGNRSLRISVAGYGDMVFELFEGRASKATDYIIYHAEQLNFFDGLDFYNILNGSLVGGDPFNTGLGGSGFGFFDDQFHPELQHVQSGLLTVLKPEDIKQEGDTDAKTFDDLNNSRFIITGSASRNYDFQNTIFGYLVEGEEVRDALSKVPVTANFPDYTITMETVDVFTDDENATLVLTAAEGTTGTSTITVTVEDQDGNLTQRQFQVNATKDTISAITDDSNAKPYLPDLPTLQARPQETIQYQIVAIDVDLGTENGNSSIKYHPPNWLTQKGFELPAPIPPGMIVNLDEDTGLLTVNLSETVVPGVYQFSVAVELEIPNSVTDPKYVDYGLVTIIVSDPPVANDDFFVIQGDTDELDILLNDTANDGSPLLDVIGEGYTVEIVTQPENGGGTVTYDSETNKINFTSNGSTYMGLDEFTYRVKDNLGAYSETATVTFSIAPEGVILVTSLLDNQNDDQFVTLSEAIQAANLDMSSLFAVPAGNGPDTIMFAPNLFIDQDTSAITPQTLLIRGEGQHFTITDSLTIIAPTTESGDPLLTIDGTLDGGDSSRHFYIDDGITANTILVSLQNLILIEGKTNDNGGSIYNAEHLVLSNSQLLNNQSTSGVGGAIFNTGTLEISNSVLQSNHSVGSEGGAIASNFGSVTLTQTTLDNNDAEGSGGGIYAMNANVTLTDSVVSNNTGFNGSGGGLYQDQGLLTVTGSSFISNSTGSALSGAGIYANETTTSITDSTFHANRSSGSGGGLSQNLGTLSVRNSTFSENEALFGDGGGIYSGTRTTSILNSTISGNTASQNGGGIYFLDRLELVSGTIDNSTIAANHADGDGGGLFFQFIMNTIEANNSIIADNTASGNGADGVGSLLGRYSLIENTDGLDLFSTTNFITGQDPGLLPLADNGGSTQTHALSSGSLAIDAGDPAFDPNSFTPTLALDQRGSARVADGNNDSTSRLDIGAYEAESVLASTDLTVKRSVTNVGSSGQIGALPSNVDFIDEWNPVIVEIWVSITNSSENGISSALVDLNFDAQYLIADSIEYGPGFTANQTATIDNVTGMITGLGASTSQAGYGAETLVLLARVHLSVKPVPLETDGHYIEPVADLNFQILNSTLLSSVGAASVTEGAAVNLTLVPALYDLDDNGSVDFRDLVQFINVYNKSTGATAAPDVWAADFDRSGTVNIRDLILLISNYNKVQGSGTFLFYPSNFDEIWQQNNLVTSLINSEDTTSQSLTVETVEPVLNAAKEQLAETHGDSVSEELADVKIEVVELSGNQIAKANADTRTIYLDVNAAGWGWFVDSTPFQNEEFNQTTMGIFDASLFSPAEGQIDLLTVLLHELGHLLGYDHDHESTLMEPALDPGERKLSSYEESDDFFSGYLDSEFDGIN
ncbi:putative peptidyl-prolyl cis-trans isomerase [Gimesia alba]|uniref:Putative peptidyl-prolyl cis-trans isomerase n=1 Tax=Gimesia alba TaxID=2527973 RepID=A0A517RK29_9PLAN|nr:choice-of-anchor Q domain-containing protein [Gimesia alba]QDT44245.1 putative peptidyl-prolyl cis-trans isomerase [Gimesia alba]